MDLKSTECPNKLNTFEGNASYRLKNTKTYHNIKTISGERQWFINTFEGNASYRLRNTKTYHNIKSISGEIQWFINTFEGYAL